MVIRMVVLLFVVLSIIMITIITITLEVMKEATASMLLLLASVDYPPFLGHAVAFRACTSGKNKQ